MHVEVWCTFIYYLTLIFLDSLIQIRAIQGRLNEVATVLLTTNSSQTQFKANLVKLLRLVEIYSTAKLCSFH